MPPEPVSPGYNDGFREKGKISPLTRCSCFQILDEQPLFEYIDVYNDTTEFYTEDELVNRLAKVVTVNTNSDGECLGETQQRVSQ